MSWDKCADEVFDHLSILDCGFCENDWALEEDKTIDDMTIEEDVTFIHDRVIEDDKVMNVQVGRILPGEWDGKPYLVW